VRQCQNVLLLGDMHQVDDKVIPVVQGSAARIGITFTVRQLSGAFATLQTPRNNVPIAEFPGWLKDYPDPLTFFEPLFGGRGIIATGNSNYPLVGMTPATAKKVGATGSVAGVPSVDALLDRCAPLAGQPRLSCYEPLDRYLTATVVPWVPFCWSYKREHHERERDEVAVRPVLGLHRVRVRRREAVVRPGRRAGGEPGLTRSSVDRPAHAVAPRAERRQRARQELPPALYAPAGVARLPALAPGAEGADVAVCAVEEKRVAHRRVLSVGVDAASRPPGGRRSAIRPVSDR
jgi:hypothetical protein